MLKKTVVFFALMFLITPILPAQQGPGPGDFLKAAQRVADYLELTEEQRDAWRELITQFHETVTPIMEEIKSLEQELASALGSDAEPDPTYIGQLVIQIHTLREEVRMHRENYQEGFLNLLTEEQVAKYEAVLDAFALQPLFPAFRITQLIP